MEKRCELCCDAAATMYCESDAASLCLRCDSNVHGANFIVAKHERSLLCSVCYCMTSWKASGPKLGRTVTVCDGCVCDRKVEEVGEVESRDRSDGDDEPDGSSDDDDEDEDEDDDVEEDDEDNQVVPWSSGEEVSSSGRGLKRRRDIADLDVDEEIEDGRRLIEFRGLGSEQKSNADDGIEPESKENQTDHSVFRAGNQISRISG